MSIISKLTTVRDALSTLEYSVFHYSKGITSTRKYIVWMETGEGESLHLNNQKDEQTIEGTIDLFTTIEYDPIIDDIQRVLNEKDISFVLSDVQYEEENDIIHYTWEWEL